MCTSDKSNTLEGQTLIVLDEDGPVLLGLQWSDLRAKIWS